MSDEEQDKKNVEPERIPFSEFLESTPPGIAAHVSDLAKRESRGPAASISVPVERILRLQAPDLQLHCSSEPCNGTRFFRYTGSQGPTVAPEKWINLYLTYRCSNCSRSLKTFSLCCKVDDSLTSGMCSKYGESPAFGPPTPARLITLVGTDRETFLNGRRCENQGLGIGAFVYYRRVVENQKNRILDEIIRVSRKMEASSEQVARLEAARSESQFSKALSNIKDAVPQSLLINGHNPLVLLHSALSQGLHSQTDEDCLQIATSIRVVLSDLSERLSQALKDESELRQALSTLLNKGKN